MSLPIKPPGILVAQRPFGHGGRVRPSVPTIPSAGFAGQQGRDRAHHGLYLTAAIAQAITAY